MDDENALAAVGPRIWAYYHGWYGTPDGPAGRWMAWQHPLFGPADPVKPLYEYDPERFLGPGIRDLAVGHYPRLGAYDSTDVDTLRRHVEWALEAGIDGFIVDWVGTYDNEPEDLRTGESAQSDRCLAALLDLIDDEYPEFAAFALMDTHWWRYEPLEQTIADLEYVHDVHMRRRGYARASGRPIAVYLNTFVHHQPTDWQALRAALRDGARDVFLMGDDLEHPELFDALAPYLYPGQGERWAADEDMLRAAVERVTTARGDLPVMAPVMPGYDDRSVHAAGEYVIPRGGGEHYRLAWRQWRDAHADWIAINSWNGWFEGTAIEPDRSWGDLFLRLTRAHGDAFRAARAGHPDGERVP